MTDKNIRILVVVLLLLATAGAAYSPGPMRGIAVLTCAALLAVVLYPRG